MLKGLRSLLLEEDIASPWGQAWHAFMAASSSDAVAMWFGVQAGSSSCSAEYANLIDRDIAELDRRLGRILNNILHHPRFQRLEALWRGLALLAERAEEDPEVQLRIIDMRWAELARDLLRAPEFDQSLFFQKVYSQEFDMPGGTPYSLVLADYPISHHAADSGTDDLTVLREISRVAAAAFCPVIFTPSPTLLELDRYEDFYDRQDVKDTFLQDSYQRFRAFQDTEDSRFVGFVIPNILLRTPYRSHALPELGFVFDEETDRRDSSSGLWGGSIFALADVAIRSFSDTRWLAFMRGTPEGLGGGLVNSLQRVGFDTDGEGVIFRTPLDVLMTDSQESQLNDLGFVVLRDCVYTPFAAFYNVPAVHQARERKKSAEVVLSTRINFILCVSRFAHYIKVIARDWIGKYQTAEECESALTNWIRQYCDGSDNSSAAHRARYPLKEARISVREIAEKPGSFSCTAVLRPHFQLDKVAAEFRLITEAGRLQS